MRLEIIYSLIISHDHPLPLPLPVNMIATLGHLDVHNGHWVGSNLVFLGKSAHPLRVVYPKKVRSWFFPNF